MEVGVLVGCGLVTAGAALVLGWGELVAEGRAVGAGVVRSGTALAVGVVAVNGLVAVGVTEPVGEGSFGSEAVTSALWLGWLGAESSAPVSSSVNKPSSSNSRASATMKNKR